MKRNPIRLGPLALLLTVVSICLAILAVLTLTTAGADQRLAQRYAETVSQQYRLEAAGQEALAAFPEGFEKIPSQSASQTALPEGEPSGAGMGEGKNLASPFGGGGTDEVGVGEGNQAPLGGGGSSEGTDGEGALWKTIQQDDLTLTIGAVPGPDGSCRVVAWEMNRQWTPETRIEHLWNGSE